MRILVDVRLWKYGNKTNSNDLNEDFTTRLSDEFWKRLESVVTVLTHMNLQSCNANKSAIIHATYNVWMYKNIRQFTV